MTQNFKTLRGKLRNYLVPANIVVGMTGVAQAMQDRRGMVTLTYCDGTTEQRQSDKDIADYGFFALVDFVQAGRAQSQTA